MKTTSIWGCFTLLAIATAFCATPKDGDLVRNSSGTVFLIKDGQRCGIPNTKTFKANGYKWTNVIDVADADIEALPEGQPLKDANKRAARKAAAKAGASLKPYSTPNDGDLVQGTGGAVFLIRSGKRSLIPDGKIFSDLGLAWEKVIHVSDEDLEAIPQGADAVAPYKKAKEGDLIQGSGEAVFVIREGKRCGIASGEQFKEMGFKWENVIKISDEDLEAIPEGSL